MAKKFPELKTDEEADDWLQSADLTDYDLSEMKKVRFELGPKDTSISQLHDKAKLTASRVERIVHVTWSPRG